MAKTFDLDSIKDEDIVHCVIEKKIRHAYNLLRSSSYNDEQKDSISWNLSYQFINLEDLDRIITNLEMNQSESPNPSMKEIKQQLNKRLLRDDNNTSNT